LDKFESSPQSVKGMSKSRLETFTDGVLAIIITIMVLDLHVPQRSTMSSLIPLIHHLISYALSFIYIAIYWNNHHHLFHLVKEVNGPILWANAHLLFWLSTIPFATAWAGQHDFARDPVILYGICLFLCAVAYFILAHQLIKFHGRKSDIAHALGTDVKGKMSMFLYALAIALAFIWPYLAVTLYSIVAAMWIIPDRRIERANIH